MALLKFKLPQRPSKFINLSCMAPSAFVNLTQHTFYRFRSSSCFAFKYFIIRAYKSTRYFHNTFLWQNLSVGTKNVHLYDSHLYYRRKCHVLTPTWMRSAMYDPATVAKPPVMTACSSDFVSFGRKGRMMTHDSA